MVFPERGRIELERQNPPYAIDAWTEFASSTGMIRDELGSSTAWVWPWMSNSHCLRASPELYVCRWFSPEAAVPSRSSYLPALFGVHRLATNSNVEPPS